MYVFMPPLRFSKLGGAFACGSTLTSGLQILLVPTSEVLLTSRDRESGNPYADLAFQEDFLESHVLRLQSGSAIRNGKDGANVRDNRGKATQFTTLNGRTVVVKDAFVYSNKGALEISGARYHNPGLMGPARLQDLESGPAST